MTEAEHIIELRLRRIEHALKVLSELALDLHAFSAITIEESRRAVLNNFLGFCLGKESQDDERMRR